MSHLDRFMKLHKEGKVDKTSMIKMAAFKEELEKLSFDVSRIGDVLLTGAVIGGLGTIVDLLIDAYDSRVEAVKAARVFEEIYKDTPELNKHPREKVLKYFKSLTHHSPRVALDPVSAKAYMMQMVPWSEMEVGVPVNYFQDLASITRANPTGQGISKYKISDRSILSGDANKAALKLLYTDWKIND